MMKDCWDSVYPVGKLELYHELMELEQCAEGKDFYNYYLGPHKDSSASGLANWMKRVLNSFGWLVRENIIGQTVPEH